MNKIILFTIASFVCIMGRSQVLDPVKWSFAQKKTASDSYEIHLTATIDPGWHTYSQTTPEGGPIPTTITFSKNPLLIFNGKAKEVGKLEQHNEPLFGVDVKQYSNKVDFVQVVKLKSKAKTSISGTVEFMVCNDHECLPPKTESFNIQVK